MRAKIHTDGFEGYAKRSLERAKKLSKRRKVEPEMAITFEDPLALAKVLTPERIRVCQIARTGAFSMSALAEKLGRDPKAVSRDVFRLEGYGLLRTHWESNPGHGRLRIVEPVAERFELRVTF